jgi:phosphatidylglycerol---prolipoprotein diacylglyceryl transferase
MQPVLFTIPKFLGIGPIPIHSYGVMIIIAFLVALWIARKRAKKFGLDSNKVSDMSFWALIAGILGARIAFILQDLGYYLKHKDELFSFKFAGLTSFGGVIAGLGFIIFWAKRAGWPIRLLLDVIAPAGLVMHAIGRVGCLLNGCCYGGVCPPNLPWGIHVDKIQVPMHPAQIYDALMNLAAVPFVLWVEKKGQSKGQIFALALALHGLARFIYEFWRAGTEQQVKANLASSTYWGNLPITQAQAMAAALVIVGLALYVAWRQPAPAQQELVAS